MSELTKRILFGIVAAPLGVAIIYFGDAAMAATLGMLQAMAAWELYRMASAASRPFAAAGIVAAALVPLGVHAHSLGVINLPVTSFLPLLLLLPLTAAIWFRWPGNPLVAVGSTVFGVLYVSMLSYMYPIRHHEYAIDAKSGTVLVVLPVMLTWASDIGGYVFGRLFGKHKLIPQVSPSKTIEGAVGGLLLTVVVCWLYVHFALRPIAQLSFTTLGTLTFGVLISVVAQIGDLAESLLKREAGIKDSSTILPGHGGILDRFDSMLFVMPTAYVLLGWLLVPFVR